jgi:hypothetical protein
MIMNNVCANCGAGLNTNETTSPFCSLSCQEEYREYQREFLDDIEQSRDWEWECDEIDFRHMPD